MHRLSELVWGRFVWGRAPSPVQAERSSAVAGGHNHFVFSLAAIAVAALCLSSMAHAQSKSASAPKPAAKPASPADAQLYRNSTFSFRYRLPYGWVDRTKEMQQGNEPGKAEVLLAVFQRPPEATADTVNSAVVIASESVSSYPGLKGAEDYLGPLTELATAKGFKPEGEPYMLEVESRKLLRADFIKPLEVKRTSEKLTMRQCTLVLLSKGQIVSFTFIAASDEELDELMDGLHFGGTKSPPH
ncbi:MAG: hypothetical protein ACLPVW_14205 [Terriglobales bacterium]